MKSLTVLLALTACLAVRNSAMGEFPASKSPQSKKILPTDPKVVLDRIKRDAPEVQDLLTIGGRRVLRFKDGRTVSLLDMADSL